MFSLIIVKFRYILIIFSILLLSYLLNACFRVSNVGNDSSIANFNLSVSSHNTNENRLIKQKMSIDNDFDLNYKLWVESKIVNYRIELNIEGAGFTGPAPVNIEVREGKSISLKRISEIDPRPIEFYESIDSVEKLFTFIQKEKENGADVIVKYNKKFGYPEEVVWVYLKPGNFNPSIVRVKKFEMLT